MKQLTLLVLSLLVVLPSLSAIVRTVDRNAGAVAMYTNIPDAYEDANPGDTILITGSGTGYGSLDCYKELHFIGAGYFLVDNEIPGLNTKASVLSITFKKNPSIGLEDSSGSSCVGIAGGIIVDDNVSEIVIDKCANANSTWTFNGGATVSRCYVRGTNRYFYLRASGSSVSNSIIENLYLQAISTSAVNCVVTNYVETVQNSSITNTIFILTGTDRKVGSGGFTYCMNVGADLFTEGEGNVLPGQLVSNVFLDHNAPGNVDNFYRLNPDETKNPAIDGGQVGNDTVVNMGAFGGSNPYLLSGLTDRPRMTYLSVPGVATGNSPLTIGAAAQSFPE